MGNEGESDHFPEILEILEILEIPEIEKTLFVMTPEGPGIEKNSTAAFGIENFEQLIVD